MLHRGVTISYATSTDTVAAEMAEIRPTVMAAVPRLYEKIYARVLDTAVSGSPVKKQIFFWAKRRAETWVEYTLARRKVPASLAFKKRLGDRLVFAKLRARTGGRVRFFVSGGAPLNPDIAKFFHAAGLPILEGYGLTETSPVIACNTFEHLKLGTVGRPIPGVEVRIADDGEILTRGPHVMMGYYNKPEATARSDRSGRLVPHRRHRRSRWRRIPADHRPEEGPHRDRGRQEHRSAADREHGEDEQVRLQRVMLGDKRKFPVMIVVPNVDNLKAWAAHRGFLAPDDRSLLRLPEVTSKMDREVRKTLRDLAQFEIPKRLLLVPTDFTVETGELTPTLKVKRRVVERNYAAQIEGLYHE